jgi:hypothetical protein
MKRKWTAEQANLLAMAQIMTRLRYNDPSLLDTLGGEQALIESPLIQDIEAQSKHECIGLFLEDVSAPFPKNSPRSLPKSSTGRNSANCQSSPPHARTSRDFASD